MFRLVVLPCFDLCRSNSFHVHVHVHVMYVCVHFTVTAQHLCWFIHVCACVPLLAAGMCVSVLHVAVNSSKWPFPSILNSFTIVPVTYNSV